MNRQIPRAVISKMAAAKRQLNTALRLWFYDSDAVSVHTLVYAAYEIICDVCEHRGTTGEHILYDSERIKPEYRALWNAKMREHGNFFKHADRDPNAVIEFAPALSEMFMMYAVVGLSQCGEELGVEANAFQLWTWIHYPEFLTSEFKEMLESRVPVKDLQAVGRSTKAEFFENYQQAYILTGRRRM